MSKEITDNPEASRYEIHVDGALAGFAEYTTRPGEVVFTHTEIDKAFGGQGVGGALARGALDEVRAKGGVNVVPQCSFIKSWIDKHPDYADLVA
ncbi:GNAT family N-acetyltransferase [Actinomadura sp. 9N407]|uniref:GNAT family N-acetyltransferase n=1 Tax=Actinomadura sp. 9N407 TaxID=3375154 RepID=UPI0037AFFCFD